MLGADYGRMKQSARGLVHGQSAQTMAEEREWPVQQRSHLGYQLIDKLIHVGNRRLVDACEPAGRLDCDHLDRRIDKLRPISVDPGAASSEWKTKKPKSGGTSGPNHNEPVGGTTVGNNRYRRWPAFIANLQVRREWPAFVGKIRLSPGRRLQGLIVGP